MSDATDNCWRFNLAVLGLVLALGAPMRKAIAQGTDPTGPVVLVPDAVWDGRQEAPQKGLVVVVKNGRIDAVGRAGQMDVPTGAERVELPGATRIAGLIEGHSHLSLQPYHEAVWEYQV